MKGDTFQSFEPNALPLDAFEMDTSTAKKPVLKTKGGWKYDAGSLNTPDLTECTDPDAANDSLIIYDASAGGHKRAAAGVLTAPPIGFVYWQLPGKVDPATLYPGTTWSNISSSFPGDFFRAEGGNASAFGSGEQPMELQTHSHALDESSYSGAGNTVAVGINPSMYPGNSSTNNSGGLETRPVNRTIRLWERTA